MNKIKCKYLSVLASVGLAALLYPSPALAQSLGSAESFAVLGGSAVTAAGGAGTVITGDVGVAPGTSITGFPPALVALPFGIHANDAAAIAARSSVTALSTSLAAGPCTSLGPELGGVTVGPGIYCFSSTANIAATESFTLSGSGTYIFQVGSALTANVGSSVILIGANPCNVFWRVTSAATLNGVTFAGTVVAEAGVTLGVGANLNGRALAGVGGPVTMAGSNTVGGCSVAVGCPTITLAPSTLPNGAVGTAYSQTITASGGTAPYTFSVISGAPPTGLTLSAGGTLSGTPTATGSFTFTVRATDAAGCFGSRIYTIVINPVGVVCPSITLSPSTLLAATAGTAYSQTITASPAATYTFSVTSGVLPPGLSLASSGLLSGTPTTPGSYTFTITATDTTLSCLGSQIYTVLVNCPTITISPTTLPNTARFIPYNQQLTASGGAGPFTFVVTGGSLPSGITLSSTGLLSGQTSTAGAFNVTISATASNNCAGSQGYAFSVAAEIPTLSEWGLILLASLLALVGFVTLRKSGRMQPG